jgi:RNA polymerase sigma factor, sigma-70 family
MIVSSSNWPSRRTRGLFPFLLDKYRAALIGHIQKYVPQLEDAEDICQRSFEKAFMNIEKYNSKYAFSTWLYNIAQNEAIDHLRRNKTLINSVSITTEPEAVNIGEDESPEDRVIIDQAVAELTDAIKMLPDAYRQVAELRFIKDFAYEDISNELQLPLGTVKTRINRARKMLVESVKISIDGRTE